MATFRSRSRVESTDAFHELFREETQAIRGVANLETRVVLQTAKEKITVPVPDGGDGETSGSSD